MLSIEVGKSYIIRSSKGDVNVFPLSIEDDTVCVKMYKPSTEESYHLKFSKESLENHPSIEVLDA